MNSYLPQTLVWDHIRESRQEAAAASKVRAAGSARRQSGTHARRAAHRLARGA